tara:strand:+ start:3067 stop:3390 length:324 start_codon:yes stop_codon:yes gene_type:complete
MKTEHLQRSEQLRDGLMVIAVELASILATIAAAEGDDDIAPNCLKAVHHGLQSIKEPLRKSMELSSDILAADRAAVAQAGGSCCQTRPASGPLEIRIIDDLMKGGHA